jgi:hypothetical protein
MIISSSPKHCELYYKNITIINDTSRVIKMMIVSDAVSCGITYDCHSDNFRGVIYAPREHLFIVQSSLMMMII